MKPHVRPSSSTPPAVAPLKAPRSERGYVLFIVLIVGIAAGIAAMSLSSTRGSTELTSIHSDVGDRSQVIAEAGMQRAVFFLTDRIRNEPDFDSVLDVGLDKSCGGQGLQLPDAEDARPPIGSDPMEWNDPGIGSETIGGKNYTCVPFGGGRYCVRFEDDDDDGTIESDWDRITGNNEDGVGGCDPNGCLEGPAPGNCPNHNNGQRNAVRDRNRAIWVMSVGIYPDVPYDQASHRTTLRRYHVAPLVPSNAGLRIKGDLQVGAKGGGWYACSDVGGIEIDGNVNHAGVGCTSGVSFADNWSGSALCSDNPAKYCGKANWDGLGGIDAIGGGQYKPGPHIDPMPDVWGRANQWVDFERECVFWVEWGSAAATPPRSIQAAYPGTPDADTHQLWWWDANERRGPRPPGATQPALCSEFETLAGPNARMPGPPNPAKAGQSGSLTDERDWAGCWSPLIIDGMQFDPNDAWPNIVSAIGLGVLPAFNTDEHDCWMPPFRSTSNPLLPISPERPISSGPCAWRPHQTEGEYHICTGGNSCGALGRGSGLLPGKGPLNQRLEAEGMPEFPMSPPMKLSKPNWSECTVFYPPDDTVIDGVPYPPQPWNCTTCDGTHNVLQSIGSQGLWFKMADHASVTAVPAGVYFFTNGITNLPTGSSIDWSANAATPAGLDTPWDKLSNWPLTTIMTDGQIKLQRGGFTWGIGQTHPGAGNDGVDSPWARFASWIVGGRLTLQGSGDSATAGSVYAGGGADWSGDGSQYVFGQLFSNADFKTSGSGEFFWIYRVDLGGRPAAGGAGMFPSQSPVSQ